MIWIVLVLLLAFFFALFVRRRRERLRVLPSEPISTLHSARSKKTDAATKAALDAASLLLK